MATIEQFEDFVRDELSSLKSYARTRIPVHQVDDLVQDTLVRVWENIDKVDDVRPYAWQSVRNACSDHLRNWHARRRQGKLHSSIVIIKGEAMIGNQDGKVLILSEELPTDYPYDERVIQRLHAVINEGLSELQRAALFYRYWHDMSMVEIADELGIAEGAAKALLFRAKKKLREEYASYIDYLRASCQH